MNLEEKRSQANKVKVNEEEKQQQRPTNIWKWAFLILLGLLIGCVTWFAVQIFSQPADTEIEDTTTQQVASSENIHFEVRSEKQELEDIANQFLQKESKDNSAIQYKLTIRDSVVISGELNIFNIPVDFELNLDPYVMQNGNLQLRATDLSLGDLRLPVSFVMKQMDKQLNLPDMVSVNADSKFIVVQLDEFYLDSGIHFSMEHINLEQNDIRVNVYIPKETE